MLQGLVDSKLDQSLAQLPYLEISNGSCIHRQEVEVDVPKPFFNKYDGGSASSNFRIDSSFIESLCEPQTK